MDIKHIPTFEDLLAEFNAKLSNHGYVTIGAAGYTPKNANDGDYDSYFDPHPHETIGGTSAVEIPDLVLPDYGPDLALLEVRVKALENPNETAAHRLFGVAISNLETRLSAIEQTLNKIGDAVMGWGE